MKTNTFALIYGFAEGPRIANKLVTSLELAGLKQSSIENADIIIAHSGGCYLVPHQIKASKIMLVGLSTWPEVNLLKAIANKLKTEKPVITKLLWNALYAFAHPYKNWQMLHSTAIPNPSKTIIVHNKQDAYFPANRAIELRVHKGYTIMELDGYHDDIWDNPKPYVDLVALYARH